MSKKTLPDELRSVLLARSLDAPEPDDTVEQILAATVGTSTAASPASPSRRWWTSNQLLGAAVVMALLVLGVGAYSLRGGFSSSSSTGASSNGAGRFNTNQGGAPALGSAQSPSALDQHPNAAQAPGAISAVPPVPTDLPCTSIPGGHPVVGAHISFTLTSTGDLRYVYEFLCVGTNGTRSASEVQVFRLGPDGRLSYLSTLVPVGKDGHLDYLAAVPNGVRVQGTDQSAGPRPGDVVSVTYTTADGGLTFSSAGKLVAAACQRADLTAQVVTTDGGITGHHQVLQLTNLTANPCGLEGFPTLVALANGQPTGPVLMRTLNGPAGGVTKAKVPPIVVLIPGGTAGAIIEPSIDHPTCGQGNQLQITLPDGATLGPVPANLPTCGLQVHPLVDNPYGSD
ncbi:MAG TPA: DUF4232 domain-containing protein [Jatrophihabitans sp.]|nr:DUF4232 domain-containing protein [Jatrophihabitans sp.]